MKLPPADDDFIQYERDFADALRRVIQGSWPGQGVCCGKVRVVLQDGGGHAFTALVGTRNPTVTVTIKAERKL